MCITDWTLFMTVCFYVTAFDFLLYNHLYITVAEGGNVMAYSIGIDLGGTNIVVGIVDDSRKIVDRKRVKTRAPRSAESLVDTMADTIDTLLTRQELSVTDLLSIGIGVPGVVDPETGMLLHATNLFLKHVDFPALLRERFPDVPVFIANDADCAVFGEYLAGAAHNYKSVLMLTLGTGIGGGFVFENKIFRGATGFGIEPGHMAIETGDRIACSCGQWDCLEVYASIRGLKRMTCEALSGDDDTVLRDRVSFDGASFNARYIFEAASEGDVVATMILDRFVHYLAIGIRNLVVLYRPHMILLGGGISHAGDVLLEPLRARVAQTTVSGDVLPPPPIERSNLGNDAGVIGAAMLYSEGQST